MVAYFVLHTWCLIKYDEDVSEFEALTEEQELATDINNNIPANIVMSEKRLTSGGVTKHDILCEIVAKLP